MSKVQHQEVVCVRAVRPFLAKDILLFTLGLGDFFKFWRERKKPPFFYGVRLCWPIPVSRNEPHSVVQTEGEKKLHKS